MELIVTIDLHLLEQIYSAMRLDINSTHKLAMNPSRSL